MKKLIISLMSIIIIFALGACGYDTASTFLTDDEMQQIVEEMIPKLEESYDVIQGNIEVEDKIYYKSEDGTWVYSKVTDDRFKTIDDIRNYIASIYTNSYIVTNLSQFSSSADWQPSDMYYQRANILLRNSVYNIYEGPVYSADKVTFSNAKTDSFTADIKYRNSDGYYRTATIEFVKENNSWKIKSIITEE